MMTGRELIIYILQNNLEDKPVVLDGKCLDLLSEAEAAIKFNVGTATVRAWFDLGMIPGITIGDAIYILPTAKCPYGAQLSMYNLLNEGSKL